MLKDAIKKERKSSLTITAEWATIIATLIAIFAIGVSIIAIVIAFRSLDVARQSLHVAREELAISLQNIEQSAAEILNTVHPIQINIGVNDGEGGFTRRRNAIQDEELTIHVPIENISDVRMSTIAVRIGLPNGIELVSGSARLINRSNPNGAPLGDGIIDNWVNIGGYSPFDSAGRGYADILFEVKVSDNDDLFISGVNTFNIIASAAGYVDGLLVTDQQTAYASVDVIFIEQ